MLKNVGRSFYLRTIFDVDVIVNYYKNSPCPSNIQYTVHACKTDNLQVVIFHWQKIRLCNHEGISL
jgi:hypothetical protein